MRLRLPALFCAGLLVLGSHAIAVPAVLWDQSDFSQSSGDNLANGLFNSFSGRLS